MPDAFEPRLFLLIPQNADAGFAPRLEEALSAGDVAAVLIGGPLEDGLEARAAALVPIIQAADAAAIVADDTRIAGHVKADGVQIAGGLEEIRFAIQSFKPKRIVGVTNVDSRHAAMQVGELEIDYLFFGRPYGDTHDAPHPKVLELSEWWSALTQVPAVVMAGRSLSGVADAAATGAAFVALNEAVWSHPGGPGEAVRMAEAALKDSGRRAA